MTTPALLASEEITAARANLERMAAPNPVSESRTALLELLAATAALAELTEGMFTARAGTAREPFLDALLDQSYPPAVRAARRYARSIL